MTKAEKAAYDKAVAEGKAAIDAAKDVDAVNAALKKAKSVKTVTVNAKKVNAKAIKKNS